MDTATIIMMMMMMLPQSAAFFSSLTMLSSQIYWVTRRGLASVFQLLLKKILTHLATSYMHFILHTHTKCKCAFLRGKTKPKCVERRDRARQILEGPNFRGSPLPFRIQNKYIRNVNLKNTSFFFFICIVL